MTDNNVLNKRVPYHLWQYAWSKCDGSCLETGERCALGKVLEDDVHNYLRNKREQCDDTVSL